MPFLTKLILAGITLLLAMPVGLAAGQSTSPAARWWKGNLQTQSFWSDGDQMPEDVVAWYKDHGFNFVALSDHDHPPVGERWKKIAVPKDPEDMSESVHPDILEQYRKRYGDDWVETRERDGVREVRLKPVSEFGPLVNEAQRFLVLPSHQIYTHVEDDTGRVHPRNPGVAWFDIANSTVPLVGTHSRSSTEAMQQTILLVQQSAADTQRFLLLGLAHPNYRWQLTAEDIAPLDSLRFMEIHTGLAMCNSQGDEQHASAERIWDIVLTRRLAELNKSVIYGLASDDAHTFEALPGMPSWGRPGRAWIMVRSRYLSPESIFQAMERGDFYASSGVVLDDVRNEGKSLTVTIRAEPGVSYTTQFIGTLRNYDRDSRPVLDAVGKALRTTRHYSDTIGQVLHQSVDHTSTYKLRGNEIYVRAKIISSRPHPDPIWFRQVECAWTQSLVNGVTDLP